MFDLLFLSKWTTISVSMSVMYLRYQPCCKTVTHKSPIESGVGQLGGSVGDCFQLHAASASSFDGKFTVILPDDTEAM